MPKKVKILVIEDDQFLNKVYMNKLGQENFVVLTALDGVTGLQKAKDELPSLIVLDIILPKLNGFEVLEELRKDEKTKNIPIVIISNLGQEDDIKHGLEMGAKEYLVKTNYTIDEILDKIREYVTTGGVKKVDVTDAQSGQAASSAAKTSARPVAQAARDKRICPSCGNTVPIKSNFCPICGHKL